MYYLLKCNKDNSYCTVEDYEVVFDHDNPPIVNSSVSFYWNNEKFLGTVVDCSNDAAELQESAKKLAKKRKNVNTENVPPLPDKRPRKPKKSWSFTEDGNSPSTMQKNKKGLSNKGNSPVPPTSISKQVKNLIDESRETRQKSKSPEKSLESNDESSSPTKEELKSIILKQKKLLKSGTKSKVELTKVLSRVNTSDSEDSRESGNDNEKRIQKKKTGDDQSREVKESDGSYIDNPQLYGKNYGEPMILLKNDIYCTKKAFEDAVDYSRNSATSFLRRIMDGVFKPTAILKCTFSGRPPNAQGAERQSTKVEALNRDAKKAVIEFCDDYASKQGWSKVSPAKMRRAMSQWVGEKKRLISKNIDE